MKNLKVVVYFLFSLFLISGCSNSVNEEYEDNNEIAKQREVVYEYFVDADSLVVHTDPGTKGEKQPDIPKPGGGGGDSGTGSPCWCMEPPQVYPMEERISIGRPKKITFSGASRITYQGVGGGLNFAVVNGVGTLTVLKEGVYNFTLTTWRKQCENVHCENAIFKYRITGYYSIE